MEIIKLYCLSGLGTDKRAFANIKIEGVELVHIPWIDNLKNETLPEYAKRLFEHVNPEENYNLIGLSFGGMIAAEWEKIRAPKNLILLSTMTDKSDLPRRMRLPGKLKMHKIIPRSILSSANPLSYYLFGIKKNENRVIFKDILRDTDSKHLKWAMGAILSWSNDVESKGITIHGEKDRLLPKRKNKDHIVKGGGHMIVLNEGDEISAILESIIRPLD